MSSLYPNQILAAAQGATLACRPQLAQTPAQPGLVSITADSVQGRANRLQDAANRLHGIADRIYGLQAEPGSCTGNDKPLRSADADRLHYAMESLDAAIERLESGLQRVEVL